jgi:hypothetical protein
MTYDNWKTTNPAEEFLGWPDIEEEEEMDMVERVARALEPKCRAFGQGNMPMMVALEFARAAIAAMREPTEEMLRAGQALDDFDYGPCRGAADPIEHWHAMIDVALNEKSPSQ